MTSEDYIRLSCLSHLFEYKVSCVVSFVLVTEELFLALQSLWLESLTAAVGSLFAVATSSATSSKMIVIQESKSRHADQTLGAARMQDGEVETVYFQV